MERKRMPVDIVFVGGGPACLAGAIRLLDLVAQGGSASGSGVGPLEAPTIAILEKGSQIGSHAVSGAILDTRALDELLPDWKERGGFPLERYVERELALELEADGGFKERDVPKELRDAGRPIVSLGRFQEWLAGIAKEKGAKILTGVAAVDLLYDGEGRVRGVRTGDKGVDARGRMTAQHEPGADIEAAVTIIGDGPRGHLSRLLINRYGLQRDRNPMSYELGCKEILQLPAGSISDGFAYQLSGYPLEEGVFGGGFLYSLGDDRVAIGLLAGLDAEDPALDVHYLLQRLKAHPKIRELVGQGMVVKYGAKAQTVGGWGAMPRLHAPGAMLAGESASFLDPVRGKGVHLAMKSGMLAAEVALDALRAGDTSREATESYQEKVNSSWIREEMEVSQNYHADLSHGRLGRLRYLAAKAFGPGKIREAKPDHAHMEPARKRYPGGQLPEQIAPGRYPDLAYDGAYIVDKPADAHRSGARHGEDQPSFIVVSDPEICATKCAEEYGNPCVRFCPAQVFSVVEVPERGRRELRLDLDSCVHCRTCDIRDPYQIVRWVPPPGGEGPEYGIL